MDDTWFPGDSTWSFSFQFINHSMSMMIGEAHRQKIANIAND
jgi:hypothetical protein